MPSTEKERLNALVRRIVPILLLGLGYFVFITLTNIYIPCPIRFVTGYLCPGCGISHCIMHMAHLRFKEAFIANPLVFCLIPIAIPYRIYRAYSYVKYGREDFNKIEVFVFVLLLVVTIGFGIARNFA